MRIYSPLRLVLCSYLGLHLPPRRQDHLLPPLLHQRLPLRLILTPSLSPTGRSAGRPLWRLLILACGCGELLREVVARNQVGLGWLWRLCPCACLRRRRCCSWWHGWSESLWRLCTELADAQWQVGTGPRVCDNSPLPVLCRSVSSPSSRRYSLRSAAGPTL